MHKTETSSSRIYRTMNIYFTISQIKTNNIARTPLLSITGPPNTCLFNLPKATAMNFTEMSCFSF